MKTTILFFAMILLLFSSGSLSSQEATGKNAVLQKGSVSVMCTPDLFNLTSQWVNQYSNLNPGVKIKVISTEYNNAELGKSENLSIISDKSVAALSDEKNWKMVVGHDIVVPVINASNPFMKDILQKGVSQELFIKIFENPAKRTWGTLLAGNQALPITIYMVNDESVKAGLNKFLKESQLQLAGIKVGSRDEVVSALQKDPYAIGFCKAVSVQGIDNQNLVENVRFLPIDKNGNGTLDYMEDIYTDMNTFQRGVWIGKYPKVLCRDIYAASMVQPANENDLAFIKWVINDSQRLLRPG
jgi:ABC-type phosphate transport system substrate-binding protein